MQQHPKISEAEWQVMKLLWAKHPATANEIVEKLEGSASWKPKTIKTLINRLVGKNAVGFEKQGKRYLYYPLVEEGRIVREESRSFLNRYFGGTLKPMLASLIENRELSRKEIEELKEILEKAAGEAKPEAK